MRYYRKKIELLFSVVNIFNINDSYVVNTNSSCSVLAVFKGRTLVNVTEFYLPTKKIMPLYRVKGQVRIANELIKQLSENVEYGLVIVELCPFFMKTL